MDLRLLCAILLRGHIHRSYYHKQTASFKSKQAEKRKRNDKCFSYALVRYFYTYSIDIRVGLGGIVRSGRWSQVVSVRGRSLCAFVAVCFVKCVFNLDSGYVHGQCAYVAALEKQYSRIPQVFLRVLVPERVPHIHSSDLHLHNSSRSLLYCLFASSSSALRLHFHSSDNTFFVKSVDIVGAQLVSDTGLDTHIQR